jgi:hypothetical protein
MSRESLSAMSVVLVAPGSYETIRQTMEHLRAHTVRDRLEIVIVAPSADALQVDDSALKDFFRSCVVEIGPIRSTGAAIAAGVRQAHAPVVGPNWTQRCGRKES